MSLFTYFEMTEDIFSVVDLYEGYLSEMITLNWFQNQNETISFCALKRLTLCL